MPVTLDVYGWATLVGAAITLLMLTYGYGKEKAQRSNLHSDIIQGHEILHDDLRAIDGDHVTEKDLCPMCRYDDY